jgi:hypothetical protein
MATNAAPIYGKQYIRYAETWEAPTNDQAGTVGIVEIGVNQAYMPTALAQPYTARQLTVATSGLLLIEVDPASAAIGLATQLQVNSLGQATAAGTPVLYDGTQPIVRENVTIGGRRLVLVSFA